MESHHSSAEAFVGGGTQDACEDSCSICLESFYDSDPSTVTGCNHNFHLQCILDWCQRSSQCPMCWRPICLKDPTSQVLLEVVEKERIMRGNQFRKPVYLCPVLGDSEMQQLAASSQAAELDERMLQQLATAAITDRAFEIAEREFLSDNNRPTNNANSLSSVLPTNHNAPFSGGVIIGEARQGVPLSPMNPSVLASVSGPATIHTSLSLSSDASGNSSGGSNNRNSAGEPTPGSNETAGPFDLQSFSESLKSRLNAASNRYRESIKKSTRGWKQRLFSRNVTLPDLGLEVKREVNNGITSVSRMMQRLEVKDNSYGKEVSRNMNSAGASSNTNPNPSMRSHLARVAASDSSPFFNNAGLSNACAASSSSK